MAGSQTIITFSSTLAAEAQPHLGDQQELGTEYKVDINAEGESTMEGMEMLSYKEVHTADADTKLCPGEIGDIIRFNRKRIKHYAIKVSDYDVIHLTGGSSSAGISGCSAATLGVIKSFLLKRDLRVEAVVKREKYAEVVKMEGSAAPVKTIDKTGTLKAKEPEEVVRRAEYYAEQKKMQYSAKFLNCEHFATYCKFGMAFSRQSKKWRNAGVIDKLYMVVLGSH